MRAIILRALIRRFREDDCWASYLIRGDSWALTAARDA